jgi:hypothetical protein
MRKKPRMKRHARPPRLVCSCARPFPMVVSLLLLILGSAIKRKNSTPTKRNTPALPIKPMCPAAIYSCEYDVCSGQTQQNPDWSQMQRSGKSCYAWAAAAKGDPMVSSKQARGHRELQKAQLLEQRYDRYKAEQWQDGDCTNCLKADIVVAPSQTHDAVLRSVWDRLYITN